MTSHLTPASDTPAPRKKGGPGVWWWVIVLAAVVGFIVGLVVPPPYADGQWWATYLLSPGFAGTVTFLGAGTAAAVAYFNSKKDRLAKQDADQRSQWWDRFTWSTEKAVDPETSVVGVKVLNRLVVPGLATEDDARIALEVLEIVDPEPGGEGGEQA